MYKSLAVLALVAATFIPFAAFAEDAPSTNVSKIACPLIKSALSRGVNGGSVTELQNFLASYYGVSPSAIATGFFGPKTHELVVRFQKERGLDAQGFVGPLTRAAIAKACGFSGTTGNATVPQTTPDSRTQTPPPTCRMRVDPGTITANQPITFSWSSTNADYAVWGSGDKDNANETARVFSNIASTTKFTLTFYGAGGTVTCGLYVYVPGTATTTPELKKPILGAVCPMIGWIAPTTSCDGTWAPRYSTGGCQIGWQCIGTTTDTPATTTPPQIKKTICELLPQVVPACQSPTVVKDANGCVIKYECPPSTDTTLVPPLLKPAACPLVAFLPAPCSGTLYITKDSNGCQTGFRCEVGSTTLPIIKQPIACPAIWTQPIFPCSGGSKPKYDATGCQVGIECTDDSVGGTTGAGSCRTPWGAKVVADGQTIPYEPYFSNGALSTTVTIPLVKCFKSAWLLCDALGASCRPLPQLLQRLDPVGQTNGQTSFGRSASELAAALVGLQDIVNAALSAFGK